MEVLAHFIFELIKISILGSFYAVLTLGTFKIIGHYNPDSWFESVSKKKMRLWFTSGLIISIVLFFFMFTHYGDHGLGDSARIPLRHQREIQEINGSEAYVKDKGIKALPIDKFIIAHDFVYGLTDANENYDGKYFVYDLADNRVHTFEQEHGYLNFLTVKDLDTRPDYKDFSYYYRQYWSGWRFWALP